MHIHQTKHRIDVKGSDLSGSIFEDVNLSGSTLRDVNMSGWHVSTVNLAGLRKSGVEAAHHAGDSRIHAVPHDAAAQILVEPQIEKCLCEPARL